MREDTLKKKHPELENFCSRVLQTSHLIKTEFSEGDCKTISIRGKVQQQYSNVFHRGMCSFKATKHNA